MAFFVFFFFFFFLCRSLSISPCAINTVKVNLIQSNLIRLHNKPFLLGQQRGQTRQFYLCGKISGTTEENVDECRVAAGKSFYFEHNQTLTVFSIEKIDIFKVKKKKISQSLNKFQFPTHKSFSDNVLSCFRICYLPFNHPCPE